MPFSTQLLRERHKKLFRQVFRPDKLDFDYKNYESTDSDLYDKEARPKVTQEMIDKCNDISRKQRLE